MLTTYQLYKTVTKVSFFKSNQPVHLGYSDSSLAKVFHLEEGHLLIFIGSDILSPPGKRTKATRHVFFYSPTIGYLTDSSYSPAHFEQFAPA
jgi:hypothetical protein